jgi:hypothetical protein
MGTEVSGPEPILVWGRAASSFAGKGQKLAAHARFPLILDQIGFVSRNRLLVGSRGFEPGTSGDVSRSPSSHDRFLLTNRRVKRIFRD